MQRPVPTDARLRPANRLLAFAFLFLASCACAIVPSAVFAEDGETAAVEPGYCIIQPDEPASAEIFVDYNGQRVYFCCDSCRRDFLSDPSRFEGLITESSGATAEEPTWNGEPDPYAGTFWGRVGRAVLVVEQAGRWAYQTFHLHDGASIALAVLATSAIAWVAFGWFRCAIRRQKLTPRPGLAMAVALILVPCFYADRLRHSLRSTRAELDETAGSLDIATGRLEEVEDRDMIHYATFLNFGDPPIPRPSRMPPSLRKTYYRGNDERSDEMPHGGNYRTVTFDLWIEDEGGNVIDVGSELIDADGKPRDLELVIRFVRSAETSSGYFTDQYMQRMYVTMMSGPHLGRDEPVADRISWVMTRDQEEWVARYPLPEGILVREPTDEDFHPQWIHRLDESRPNDRGGVVYLCEDRFKKDRVIGGRFHYAIRYHLLTRGGKVVDDSDLWMQATYRGRNFAELQIEDDEWLSSEPIPER